VFTSVAAVLDRLEKSSFMFIWPFFNSLFHILQWCTYTLCHYRKRLSVGIQLCCGKTWITVWYHSCYHILSVSVAAYVICYPYYKLYVILKNSDQYKCWGPGNSTFLRWLIVLFLLMCSDWPHRFVFARLGLCER
jgi:hypothetical protein